MASGKIALLFLALLSGCATLGFGNKKAAEAVVATPAGAAQTPVSLIDRMSNGLMGQKLGTAFDKSDRAPALEAEYNALEQTPAGQSVTWSNPANGHGGTVTAAQPYRVGSQNCRQYAHTFSVGGLAQAAKGTACRNGDGSWTPLT